MDEEEGEREEKKMEDGGEGTTVASLTKGQGLDGRVREREEGGEGSKGR